MTNPEFTTVQEQLVPGAGSNYNALNARVAKQMGHGLTIDGVFEWSRLLGTFNQLNAGDKLNYGETTSDYPFHFSAYGTYQLPFGRGRQFFNGNRYLNPIIGGWQVSAIYQFLSGTPMSWGNVIYTGSGWRDFHNVQHSHANVIGSTVFNTAVFDTRTCANGGTSCNNTPTSAAFNPNIQPTANNYRTFPQYLLRQDYTSDWDANVQKNTLLAEGITMQLRIEAFNLLNRPQYNTPNRQPYVYIVWYNEWCLQRLIRPQSAGRCPHHLLGRLTEGDRETFLICPSTMLENETVYSAPAFNAAEAIPLGSEINGTLLLFARIAVTIQGKGKTHLHAARRSKNRARSFTVLPLQINLQSTTRSQPAKTPLWPRLRQSRQQANNSRMGLQQHLDQSCGSSQVAVDLVRRVRLQAAYIE